MKKLIREFFFLRRGERRALIAIMIFLLIVISFRIWLAYIPLPTAEIDPDFLEKVKLLQHEMVKIEEKTVFHQDKKNSEQELAPFYFDPNSISMDSLLAMHLSAYIAGNIVKYRDAGGKFRKPGELQKIYGIDQDTYAALLPFIHIDNQGGSADAHISEAYVDTIPQIDLNSADTAALMMIPGIGPSYSGRIIKYRNMLGGYYSHNQLWEVYGMDSSRYTVLCQYTITDTVNIRQTDLNRATFRELISHPYIDKSTTYAILQYRDFVDSIQSVSELDINQIIDHDRFIRVLPYLTLNSTEE